MDYIEPPVKKKEDFSKILTVYIAIGLLIIGIYFIIKDKRGNDLPVDLVSGEVLQNITNCSKVVSWASISYSHNFSSRKQLSGYTIGILEDRGYDLPLNITINDTQCSGNLYNKLYTDPENFTGSDDCLEDNDRICFIRYHKMESEQ